MRDKRLQVSFFSLAWRAVLQAVPNNAEAYAHLGLLEARQSHYQEAVQFYRKALALDPGKPAVRLDLGLSLFPFAVLFLYLLEIKDHRMFFGRRKARIPVKYRP